MQEKYSISNKLIQHQYEIDREINFSVAYVIYIFFVVEQIIAGLDLSKRLPMEDKSKIWISVQT